MSDIAPFQNPEALFATIARLFAAEGDLLAVEVLSTAKPHFEFYTHDNWNEGFDVYDLYLDLPFTLFQKLGDKQKTLEKKVLDKIQSVSIGRTNDHIQSVTFIIEVTGDKDWRKRAKNWASGGESIMDNRVDDNHPKITLQPEIFKIPDTPINNNQVAVMMPFSAEFDGTYDAIKNACISVGLLAKRADDIWTNSTFMQDVFELIYCSQTIIVDFSKRNPNVMYETGIAHTLGRHVVPITTSIDDVPSDLQHHRALVYLQNEEGLNSLVQGLTVRLSTITGREPKKTANPA